MGHFWGSEEMNDTCGKMVHTVMMGGGFIVLIV